MKRNHHFSIYTFLICLILYLFSMLFSLANAEIQIDPNGSNIVKLKGISAVETYENDRKEILLSIYNDNFALVREVREVILPSGISELRFWDISSKIEPSSVRVKALNGLGGIEMIEQNYEFDIITPRTLLDRYVGKKVKLLDKDDFSGSKGELEAVLLSNHQGPIYRIGDEIHIGHPGRVVLSELPEGLSNKPSLLWKISSINGGRHSLEVSYLTEDLNWMVDYIIALNNENTRADMYGWVTLKNNSEMNFMDSRIELIDGKVARERAAPRIIRMKEAADDGVLSKGVSEEEIFEYHLYNLPDKVTLKHNQAKQIRLFSAERIPIKKELRYYGSEHTYRYRLREDEEPQKVGVYLEFENRKTYHLGVPLPKGMVRVYKADSKGILQFLGEDRISHTPEDEKVRVQIGYASDILAERKQIDWRKPSSDLLEVFWEIILRNHKDEAIWIKIIESIPGDWEVMESTHHWEKLDASTLLFDLSAAPKSEEKIRYRIQTRI